MNSNVSFFSTLHFFWISVFYLYVFLILFFFLFFYNNVAFILIYLYIFSFHFIEIQTNFTSILNFFFLQSNFVILNPFLFNNLNKYHPGLLYYSFGIYIYIANLTFLNIFFIKFYDRTWNWLELLNQNSLLLFSSIFFSLFLGAWWAEQEGSWGGWWNWDPSENLGLFILILISLSIHYRVKYFFCVKFNLLTCCFIFFCLFIFYYCFLQLNFDFVSHNFGLKFLFFFNNNNNLFLCSLAASFLYFNCSKNFILIKLWFFTLRSGIINTTCSVYLYVYVYLFSVFLLLSLLPLFNFFLWTLLYITFFDVMFYFFLWKIYLYFVIIFVIYKYRTFLYFFILIEEPYFLLINLITFRWNIWFYLHFAVILVLALIFLSNNFYYLQYSNYSTLYTLFFNLTHLFLIFPILTTDTLFFNEYFFAETTFNFNTNLQINNLFSFNTIHTFNFLMSFYCFWKIYIFSTNSILNTNFFFWSYTSFFAQLTFFFFFFYVIVFFFFFYQTKVY